MASPSLADVFAALPVSEEQKESQAIDQVQEQGKGRFYCWGKRHNGAMPVPTMVVEDVLGASEWFIEKILASSPWPQYVLQSDGTYGPETLLPEMRICIDREGNEFLVGEVDWLDSDEMTHAELWKWFGEDEKTEFARLWSSMKRGKNSEWF